MRLLREDHQTGSCQLDLIADWGLPVLLVFFAVSMPCSTTGMSASELRESRNAIAQAASGSRATTTASRRDLVMAFSGCTDGLFSAYVGDRGWLRRLPLRGEPRGQP